MPMPMIMAANNQTLASRPSAATQIPTTSSKKPATTGRLRPIRSASRSRSGLLGLDQAEGSIVDISAGYGTFSLAAALITGQPVVAIDIDASLLQALAVRAMHKNANLQTIVRDVVADGTGLPDGYADVVLVFNLLHCERPIALFERGEANAAAHRAGCRAALAKRYPDPAWSRIGHMASSRSVRCMVM